MVVHRAGVGGFDPDRLVGLPRTVGRGAATSPYAGHRRIGKRINTGKKGWKDADLNLGLENDRVVNLTFDLKVDVGEMRGDAFLVMGIDRDSPPGGEIYVDEVSLKLMDR